MEPKTRLFAIEEIEEDAEEETDLRMKKRRRALSSLRSLVASCNIVEVVGPRPRGLGVERREERSGSERRRMKHDM